MSSRMKRWKTLKKKVVLNDAPWLVVEHRRVKLPDGRTIAKWPWVSTPDYVNVVAETTDRKFLCFKQVKYAVNKPMLGIVGGYMEKEESPLSAAKRELLEETGYKAEKWINLGTYRICPNRGFAIGSLFLARKAKLVAKPTNDDLEELRLIKLTRSQLESALLNGKFKILAWALAVALALKKLE